MKKFKEDNRGFLLAEETLKIIIAVICIIFLVYILIAIYNSHTADKKIQQAKDIFNRTDTIISSLQEGQSENQDILNPQGWHLYSFVEQEKPNFCLNEKCLCICGVSLIKQLKPQAKKCDETGACLVVPTLAASKIDLRISGTDNALFIKITKQSGKIFVEELK